MKSIPEIESFSPNWFACRAICLSRCVVATRLTDRCHGWFKVHLIYDWHFFAVNNVGQMYEFPETVALMPEDVLWSKFSCFFLQKRLVHEFNFFYYRHDSHEHRIGDYDVTAVGEWYERATERYYRECCIRYGASTSTIWCCIRR